MYDFTTLCLYVAERRVRSSLVDNPGPPPLRVLREPQGPLPTVPGSRRGLLLQVRVRRGLPEHLRVRPTQATLLRGLLPVSQCRQVPRGHRHERLHLLAQHPLSVRLGARHAAASLRRAALEALAGQDLRPPPFRFTRTFHENRSVLSFYFEFFSSNIRTSYLSGGQSPHPSN